jgi:hypothetical protein
MNTTEVKKEPTALRRVFFIVPTIKRLITSLILLILCVSLARLFFFISSSIGFHIPTAIEKVVYIFPFIIFVVYAFISIAIEIFVNLRFLFRPRRFKG